MVWAKQLYGWGWLARVAHLRTMAIELLAEKGDKEKLGDNWHLKFLSRYPNLKSKFAIPRDRKRYDAQMPEIINHWFKLYDEIKRKYEVDDDDVYNFNKKGVMQGVAGKMKILIPKTEKNPYHTHPGKREWATSNEYISLTRRKLSSWTIFKAKKDQLAWHTKMKELGITQYHIATSPNGWIDNEIGLAYLKAYFEPQTC